MGMRLDCVHIVAPHNMLRQVALVVCAYALYTLWKFRVRKLATVRARAEQLSEESSDPKCLGAVSDDPRLHADKLLYHQLQNLEDHPEAVVLARDRLTQLLDSTVAQAPRDGILSIDQYSARSLQQHFAASHASNARKYEEYLTRRTHGGPREMFPSREYAVQWLQLAAPVKYVDGGWLGTILDASVGGSDRAAARLAWQVISEEFGDGDLDKNHVYVYHNLVDKISLGAPRGDDKAFSTLPASSRCYTAAVAQQCIGLLASEYLPESLGFNMAYETLPYHLLVTTRELRELRIDDYYFSLHVTIDNPDSGHAALARVAVERYLEGVEKRDGPEAMAQAWRRVQAGVILADGVPTTPSGPQAIHKPNTRAASPREQRLVNIIQQKCVAASKMHCPSRVNIQGRTIEQWLDPATFTQAKGLEFLRALGEKRPWVVRGDSGKSRLVRELEWGGRMFGAFSRDETRLVKEWIGSLGKSGGEYRMFIGDIDSHTLAPTGRFSSLAMDLVTPVKASNTLLEPPQAQTPAADAALWFTFLSLLEHFPLSPSKFATPIGARVLRILRAQHGFPDLHTNSDICAGMDDAGVEVKGLWEIGRDCFARQGCVIESFARLAREVESDNSSIAVSNFCADLLELRGHPYRNQAMLLGLTQAYTRNLSKAPLPSDERVIVDRIAGDILASIHECICDAGEDWLSEFRRGVMAGESCVAGQCGDGAPSAPKLRR